MLAVEGLTTAAVNAHVAPLRARLLARLSETPLAAATLLNPPGEGPAARFLALQHPDAPRWAEALIAAGVIVDVRAETLRIGFGLYQDGADVDAFIDRARARLV